MIRSLVALLLGVQCLVAQGLDEFIPFHDATGNHLLPDLLAFWRFDEASGNAPDSSANARTLTINGGITSGTGIVSTDQLYGNANNGSVLNTDYFSRASEAAFAFTGGATITAWANMTQAVLAPNDMTLVAKGTGLSSGDLSWWLSFDHGAPNDFFRFYWSGDGAFHSAQNVAVDLGGAVASDWYFVAFRWDGSTVHLSVTQAGLPALEPDSTGGFSGPFYSGTSPLSVGALPAEALFGFAGDMDEIGIWSRYLSDCELVWLFTAEAGTFTYPSFDSSSCLNP